MSIFQVSFAKLYRKITFQTELSSTLFGYNKADDSHTLFIDAEGTEEQVKNGHRA